MLRKRSSGVPLILPWWSALSPPPKPWRPPSSGRRSHECSNLESRPVEVHKREATDGRHTLTKGPRSVAHRDRVQLKDLGDIVRAATDKMSEWRSPFEGRLDSMFRR